MRYKNFFLTKEDILRRSCRFLRSSETNLQIPLLRTSMGHNAFCNRGAKLWNELNREAKLAPSLAIFKKSTQ